MLEVDRVSLGYERSSASVTTSIVKDISFSVHHGEIFAIVGTSGSGKTTLLRMLAGILPPSKGRVTWQHQDTSVWFSPQAPILINFRTAMQNALLGRETSFDLSETDLLQAEQILIGLGLEDKWDAVPAQLSGGMKRRVALAQAILSSRQLVLLDEPFAELDTLARQRAESVIFSGRRAGSTIILVSHDLDSVCALCDRALILSGPPLITGVVMGVPNSITTLPDGPTSRRHSSGFPAAVAALQKLILELG
jgi:ABC-type nitrate/sulfonate/bicarbonate transport system ATPase subunit